MLEAMEPPMRNSSAFISEASETLQPVRRKRSIRQMDINKRLSGVADKRDSVNDGKAMDETGETEINESQPSTWDSLHALAGSDQTKEYASASSLQGKVDEGPICFCGSRSAGPSGKGKTAEEIIDFGTKNLNEASNALTNLGENFENNLRLMFMDIMGRVQHWVSVGQNRINAAKLELESLEKESSASSAKDMQLEELRRRLEETEEKLAAQIVKRNSVGQASQAEEEQTSVSVQTADPSKDKPDKLQSETGAGYVVDAGDLGEETTDREAELEAELAQLLEENERMLREREEYENAIHCALLRGVSSLNVEAFKVLRCPPIPCCSPCRPPSTPRSASPETVITCRPMSRGEAAPRPVRRGSKTVSKSDDKTRERNGAGNANRCLLQPLSKNLLYCSPGGNDRSQDNDMLFLLHHGDAGNLCQPCAQPRHRPSVSGSLSNNKGSVCTGGKCRKTSVTTGANEKVSRSSKSPAGSRGVPFDTCVRTRHDIGENGILNKKNANTTPKRCGTCNRNRINRDD